MNLLDLFIKIVFWFLIGTMGIFTLSMVYVLLRFGKSKILGLSMTIFYALIIFSLFLMAIHNYTKLIGAV